MIALAAVLRVGLAAMLAWAGVAKLGDPATFAEEIAHYRLWPTLAPLLSITLPTIEITTALVLVVAPRAWRAGAALLALVLLVAFTVAVGTAWVRGIDVACGCFGAGGSAVSGLTVARDVLFVAWSALVLRGSSR